MSENNRVIWSEGMFLRPHHYQQYTRYLENYVEERSASLIPCSWGFAALGLDQKQLGLGKVVISEAKGVFADGTPFNIPHDNEPPPAIDIDTNAKESVVYLCLPLRRAGTPEVDNKGEDDSLARISPRENEIDDNSSIGGSAASIQLGELRLRLMLEHEHRDNYTCIGVGRITEVRQDGSLVMDEGYMVSSLHYQVSPSLRGFITELLGLLKHRVVALADRVQVSGRGGTAEVADFMMLQMVNRYLPLIGHFGSLQGMHPESFYRLAISLAGEMATFTATDKRAPDFPPYNHVDLQHTFEPVFQSLRQSLSMVLEQTAVAIQLQERRFGVRVASIPDQSLLKHASFVLAVSADMSGDEIRRRLPSQIKIGPVEQIRQLVNVALPGIMVRALPVAPRQIPFHSGYVYFELDRSGDMWSTTSESGGLAVHLAGDYPGLKMDLWAIRS